MDERRAAITKFDYLLFLCMFVLFFIINMVASSGALLSYNARVGISAAMSLVVSLCGMVIYAVLFLQDQDKITDEINQPPVQSNPPAAELTATMRTPPQISMPLPNLARQGYYSISTQVKTASTQVKTAVLGRTMLPFLGTQTFNFNKYGVTHNIHVVIEDLDDSGVLLDQTKNLVKIRSVYYDRDRGDFYTAIGSRSAAGVKKSIPSRDLVSDMIFRIGTEGTPERAWFEAYLDGNGEAKRLLESYGAKFGDRDE